MADNLDRDTYLAMYASMLERSELYLERELEVFSEQSEFVQYASRLVEDPAKLAEAIAADPRFAAVLGHILRLPLNMITLRRHRKILQEQRNVDRAVAAFGKSHSRGLLCSARFAETAAAV